MFDTAAVPRSQGPSISIADYRRLLASGTKVKTRRAQPEEELQKARGEALAELEQRAGAMGANAVIGVDIDYEVLGADNGMLMVTASGTAVVVD